MTDHVEHGTWDVEEDAPMTNAHDRVLEEAREAAREHYINSRFVGDWSPDPGLASWPEVYAKEFRDELARLAAAAGRV